MDKDKVIRSGAACTGDDGDERARRGRTRTSGALVEASDAMDQARGMSARFASSACHAVGARGVGRVGRGRRLRKTTARDDEYMRAILCISSRKA